MHCAQTRQSGQLQDDKRPVRGRDDCSDCGDSSEWWQLVTVVTVVIVMTAVTVRTVVAVPQWCQCNSGDIDDYVDVLTCRCPDVSMLWCVDDCVDVLILARRCVGVFMFWLQESFVLSHFSGPRIGNLRKITVLGLGKAKKNSNCNRLLQ
jgi:hypothetical protein